ncbi:hypothetical protein [Xanthomonas arboricola]|uniref:hypothetical protein n=1 Tax=Xanthomonas arboricola TaxID=56448 RepID=UPI00128FEDF9|nr:hypothetical protein [Xanthomonas arboricola]
MSAKRCGGAQADDACPYKAGHAGADMPGGALRDAPRRSQRRRRPIMRFSARAFAKCDKTPRVRTGTL